MNSLFSSFSGLRRTRQWSMLSILVIISATAGLVSRQYSTGGEPVFTTQGYRECSLQGGGKMNKSECNALLDLYKETGGDNWNYNNKWPDNGDYKKNPCEWDGVVCSNDGRSVRELRLMHNNMQGTLSDSFGDLNLWVLYLNDNPELSGPFPTVLSSVNISMTLDGDSFEGRIPSSRGHIDELNVANNNYRGAIPDYLKPTRGSINGKNIICGIIPSGSTFSDAARDGNDKEKCEDFWFCNIDADCASNSCTDNSCDPIPEDCVDDNLDGAECRDDLDCGVGGWCDLSRSQNPNTPGDPFQGTCVCGTGYDCPDDTNIGDRCDDGNSDTINDKVEDDCFCRGSYRGQTQISCNQVCEKLPLGAACGANQGTCQQGLTPTCEGTRKDPNTGQIKSCSNVGNCNAFKSCILVYPIICSCGTNQAPRCGDGYINRRVEQCDDGNTSDGDGCSSMCAIEPETCKDLEGIECKSPAMCGVGGKCDFTNPGKDFPGTCICKDTGGGSTGGGNNGGGGNNTTCTDGTQINNCSSTKPKRCDVGGNLVNDCEECGCPNATICQTNGTCSTTPQGGGQHQGGQGNQGGRGFVPYWCDDDSDGYFSTISRGTYIPGFMSPVCQPFSLIKGNDCKDTNKNINPGATEICGDGIDNNCDGKIDEGCNGGGGGGGNNPICGDGVREDPETCDDGNIENGDGCNSLCHKEFCGDGYRDENGSDNVRGNADDEACDDGNLIDNDGCSNTCKIKSLGGVCGNGILEGAEQCDDGNANNADACVGQCKNATCKDGYVWEGTEVCDTKNDSHCVLGCGACEGGYTANADGVCIKNNSGSTKVDYHCDADNDGYSKNYHDVKPVGCTAGHVAAVDEDCKDNVWAIHPGATELCNGLDDDCNGVIDDNAGETYYRDEDGDGYGNMNDVGEKTCDPSLQDVDNNDDCDDDDPTINPDATEVCNDFIDNNCNGKVDANDIDCGGVCGNLVIDYDLGEQCDFGANGGQYIETQCTNFYGPLPPEYSWICTAQCTCLENRR